MSGRPISQIIAELDRIADELDDLADACLNPYAVGYGVARAITRAAKAVADAKTLAQQTQETNQ